MLFNSIFNILTSLSSHTALLESCNWSEDELNLLLNQCSEIINSMRPDQFNSYNDFEEEFCNRVENFTTEDQRVILKDFLLREFRSVTEKGEMYEN